MINVPIVYVYDKKWKARLKEIVWLDHWKLCAGIRNPNGNKSVTNVLRIKSEYCNL